MAVLACSGAAPLVGPSGIVSPKGNTQFTHEMAQNIVLVGPSGVVTRDGSNIQLTHDLQIASRKKRGIGFVSRAGNIGTSGILRADGTTDLFDHDTAHGIVLVGPSGIVTRNGRNMQLTSDLKIARSKRGVGSVSARGIIGTSGILRPDGTVTTFDDEFAHNILLLGPAGKTFIQ